MLAVTPTEVLETMFHCMPSDEYPNSASRAARASWGRIPGGHQAAAARLALITALAVLAQAVADLRTAQRRLLQATAARAAAGQLATATTRPAPPAPRAAVQLAGVDTPGPPVTVRPASPGRPGRAPRPRLRGPGPGPGRPRHTR